MENIIKKIKKVAKHTRLSVAEKAEMRSVLVRHAKTHPVSNEVLVARGLPSTFFNINNFRNKKGISILVIGGLLMSGSVSLAAENTVPGDVLFPVKVRVNENVRGAVAITSKAKAEWEVRLVERRLEEVEKLAMTPGVLPEAQQVAEKNLERYSERVKNRISKFEEDEDEEDAIETALSLSDVYSIHEQVLVSMNVPSVATTTVTIATTTQVITVPSARTESIKYTLKKVQGARGDAEKKHKDLKEKYKKEKVEEVEIGEQENLSQAKEQTKSSRTRSDNKKDRKQKEERKEEVRSTVVSQEDTTIVSSEMQNEVKKLEDKKKVETHMETPKVDDND